MPSTKYPENYIHPRCKLTFIERCERENDKISDKALYKCICGVVFKAIVHNVKRGNTKSCGCIQKETPANTKHKLSRTPLYKMFYNIKARCYVKGHRNYANYRGRGITICDEWLNNPNKFINWAIENGWHKGLQVDKDIKGGMEYSPSNCLIVTSKINNNNRRNNNNIEYNGEIKTVSSWAEIVGIKASTLFVRKKLGWNAHDILFKPLMNNNKVATKKRTSTI